MQPETINIDKTQKMMTITWSDEHESMYEFGLLRAACPCATCRGGHEKMSPDPDDDIFERILPDSELTRLKTAEMVGNYALTFTWEDEHHYGIYNWPYLRKLCNCDLCKKERN